MVASSGERPARDPRARISLTTIPEGQLRQHFIVFSVSSLLMLAVRVYNGVVVAGGDPTWHQVINLIGEKGGSTMAACLGLSAIGVEGMNMVLAELMRRRREQRSASEGAARGAAQMHKLWSEWLARKEVAEANGEPFAEPPPQPPNGSGRES